MKNIYISLVFLLALASCTGVLDETKKYDADCIVLNILNGPMTTKATNDGTEYERQINRLDCFFYVKGSLDNCVYYQKVENNSSVIGQQEIPFYVDESVINTIFPGTNTECDVFVIANYPGSDDWSTIYQNTSVESLKNIVLDLFETETDGTYKHDAVDKPFIMSGFDIATKGTNNNATGTIPMLRAASKITIQVKIPEWIEVTEISGDASADGTTTTPTTVKYYPYLGNDSEGKAPLRTAFHYGVSKTYLSNNYNDELVEADYFFTGLIAYKTPVFTDGADENSPGYYTCDIEVPFYSYARTWAKGANDAPYLTLQMPWTKNSNPDSQEDIKTYYYQILVNAGGLALSANSWYDLIVNVGVLGSLTESLPTEIKSDDITYYILDWTKEPSQDEGDRYEDVVIKEYAYLMVPDKEIVINNSTTGYIPYDASHAISWVMNTTGSKTCDILPTATVPVSYSSFYVDCGTSNPDITELNISANNFSLDTDKPGYLKYEYEIPDGVYSPVYVYLTIKMTVGDKTFSEEVRIVQYPAIYITPVLNRENTEGTDRVYVNGYNSGTARAGNYSLGQLRDKQDGETPYMYIISISTISSGTTFKYDGTDGYQYIIGDPRYTTEDNLLTTGWATAPSIYQGENRGLKWYYPTNSSDDVFNVIAPKFRIVSAYSSSGQGSVNSATAAMRCAAYQEDGYPAGRWRLPTYAEVQFAVMLQSEQAIPKIFKDNTLYYFSTGDLTSIGNNPTITIGSTTNNQGSVRCVYDDWYWGSERACDEFTFTWGDEPRR